MIWTEGHSWDSKKDSWLWWQQSVHCAHGVDDDSVDDGDDDGVDDGDDDGGYDGYSVTVSTAHCAQVAGDWWGSYCWWRGGRRG